MQVIVFGRLSALQNGTDTHPERYRYRTLIGHIEGKDRFSDSELNNFLMVVGSETDQEVAGAAFGSLLAKDCLARKQFDITVVSLSGYGEWTTKIIRRHSLI
ncbi:hypothetical protein, partial [Flavitalea sp.]|nr:hypothetical protein [Flavitalea sp.]